ncbi:hypothetical protein D1159_04820 [Pseudoflavonifractor sp. 524-17]|uniref:hypothetical protein n=1 Tax=Pseudoflavonifractor sp. 524-17 TaxID=2304577 RepID=UPI00137AFA9E|nr:hypothetical protein [Pseudoflavonifractor sp. 524-17]NCE63922.1 hypothetical protein [Pseudoflavonifractor sp. 524-17]
MKNGRRFAGGALLVLTMLAAAAVPSFAAGEDPAAPIAWSGTKPDQGGGKETRVNKHVYTSKSIYNGKASNQFEFDLTDTYRVAKVYVTNEGSSRMNFSFHQGYTSNPAISGQWSLEPGEAEVFWLWSNGVYDTYWCQVSSSDGSPVRGKITVRVGTTQAEME